MSKPKARSGPRKRYVNMCVLNVKAHPHEDGDETYKKLWHAAVARAVTVKFFGDRFARIATARDDLVHGTIVGEIWTYTKVHIKGGVMDVGSGKMVDPEELSRVNFDWDGRGFSPRRFFYAFSPRHHRLGYEYRPGLSPNSLRGIVEKTLTVPSALAATGVETVDVAVEQDRAVLSQILALKLRSLEILLTRPNPDDLSGTFEDECIEELKRENARSLKRELRAMEDTPLTPSAQTKRLANLAMSNGNVRGIGVDPESQRIKTVESMDSPLKVGDWLLPKVEDLYTHLSRRAISLSEAIKKQIQKK